MIELGTPLPPHPGTIVVKDGKTNETIRTLDASELPNGFKYGETPDGWRPITTIYQNVTAAGAAWRFFTDSGEFVRSASGR